MLSFITCFDLKKDQRQKALVYIVILLERKIQDRVVWFVFVVIFGTCPALM
jgi:hypothetical protein